jgi:transposase
MPKSKQINHYPFTRESLRELDHETVIDMLLSLDAKYQQLGDYVRELVSDKYGRKTEHFQSPGQLLIFPGTNHSSADSSQACETKDSNSDDEYLQTQKRKAGHARNPLPPHLPRVPVYAPLPHDAESPCARCGAIRVVTRQILQNSRLQYVPASFYVEDLYSLVFGCSNCDCGEQMIARVPEAVENGKAAPGLLAQIGVARDFDHLPFNRQSSIYLRSGVPLCRSTISDFYAHLANILTPLYEFMHQVLLQSSIISTDDTPVKVLDRTKDKKIKIGRKWMHMGDEKHAVNLFDYTHGRGRDGPLTFLRGFTGLLQGDCFSGNLAIAAAMGTTLVACVAHARRYFIKAMLNNKEGCNQALLMFQSLYEIERTAKELELDVSAIKLMREQEAVPLLHNLHSWIQKQYALADPKSSFGKALFYCLNNWNELIQYVTDGALKIDNNHCEREMKYVAMGKKACLFFGSDQGGRNHAIVASVLSTCRRHGIEPWSYLTDVIRRLTEEPNPNLEELLPYNWKQKYPILGRPEITVVKDAPKVIVAPANFENAQPKALSKYA